MGTTTQANWVTSGVPAGITAAVGVVFKAAATSAGTGTGKAIGASAITHTELVGNPNLMLNSQPFTAALGGGYVTFQTMGPTSSSVTTPIATDPDNGEVMHLSILLSNSSIA